jgi:hypothetical protein
MWAPVLALMGAVAVVGFIAYANGGLASVSGADCCLVAAVVLAAVGYAEGGLLSRNLGAWQRSAGRWSSRCP